MKFIQQFVNIILKNRLLSLIIFAGSALTLLTMWPSGNQYCINGQCGIFFWGAHEIDAIWHIALINNAFNQVPFVNPLFAGDPLQGYNYFMDFIIYLISKVGIPADLFYFKIAPVIWLISLVWITIRLTRAMKKDYEYTCFLLFFIFFGSTFLYVFNIYHSGTIFGLDGFGGALNMINVQYAFSLIVLLLTMYVLESVKPSPKRDVLVGVLMFVNTALKFYAGLITGVFILTYYVLTYVKDRNARKFAISTLVMVLCALSSILIVYDPLNSIQANEPILSFSPLAHTKVMTEDPSKFYIRNWALARYVLQEQGWGPRLILLESFSVLLYLFFHFGTRLIGIWTVAKKTMQRKMQIFDTSLAASMLAGIIMVLCFIQRGQWWNTVQFFYFSLFLSSFFAAEFMSDLFKKKTHAKLVVAAIIVILTLPFNLDVARTFGNPAEVSSFISNQEMEALKFLKSQPNGVVIAIKPLAKLHSKPAAMYQVKSPYISAYANKISYVEGEVFLQLLGTEYKDRLARVERRDPTIFNDVDYVYAHNILGRKKPAPQLEAIFRNQEITIYKVKK